MGYAPGHAGKGRRHTFHARLVIDLNVDFATSRRLKISDRLISIRSDRYKMLAGRNIEPKKATVYNMACDATVDHYGRAGGIRRLGKVENLIAENVQAYLICSDGTLGQRTKGWTGWASDAPRKKKCGRQQ